MPIDQKKLNEMIGKLGVKTTQTSQKVHNMQRVLQNLRTIANDDTVDDRTGRVFTPAARQKVYDDNMTEARKALLA